ncbi:MAG: hypothetical protein FWC91_02890 [Defluviitaleaceae bacterium]|nr:hypothetical protein [Defluviitaleaceae bacterium]
MKKFLSLLLLVMSMFLVGCGSRLYADSTFVGTWYWDDNVQFTYIFNADGSGQRGDAQIHTFNWGTRNGELIINQGSAFRNEEWSYSIDGRLMTLSSDQGTFRYLNSTPDQRLVGSWINLEYIEQVNLNADGSGQFVAFGGDPHENINFNWYSANNILIQHLGPLEQGNWTFTVTGDTLILESLQVTGYRQEFVRGVLGNDSALLGAWAWDQDPEWEYYFMEDSVALRGYYDMEVPVVWATFNNNLVMVDIMTFNVEQWTYSITGNTLTINNTQIPGQSFSYIRVP